MPAAASFLPYSPRSRSRSRRNAAPELLQRCTLQMRPALLGDVSSASVRRPRHNRPRDATSGQAPSVHGDAAAAHSDRVPRRTGSHPSADNRAARPSRDAPGVEAARPHAPEAAGPIRTTSCALAVAAAPTASRVPKASVRILRFIVSISFRSVSCTFCCQKGAETL